jgi:hypothetical protein
MIKSITLKRKNLKYDRFLLPFINYTISYSNARSSTSAPTPQKSLNFPLNRLVLYSQLAKFRLSSLVVLTSGAGYLCYGSAIDPIVITGKNIFLKSFTCLFFIFKILSLLNFNLYNLYI